MPTILILGATGNIGSVVLEHLLLLNASPDETARVTVVVGARDPAKLEKYRHKNVMIRKFDLDEFATHEVALQGIDRLFLLTSYTVDMLAQSKSVVDAAVKANVKHIVHLGTFHLPEGRAAQCVHHFIWHQYIENYIKSSGIEWTFVNPNELMQNLRWDADVSTRSIITPQGDAAVGYVHSGDVAEIVAVALLRGPTTEFGSKTLFLSSEVLHGIQMAEKMSDVLAVKWSYTPLSPDAYLKRNESNFEVAYGRCLARYFRDLGESKFPEMATTTTTIQEILHRKPRTFEDFIRESKALFSS